MRAVPCALSRGTVRGTRHATLFAISVEKLGSFWVHLVAVACQLLITIDRCVVYIWHTFFEDNLPIRDRDEEQFQ